MTREERRVLTQIGVCVDWIVCEMHGLANAEVQGLRGTIYDLEHADEMKRGKSWSDFTINPQVCTKEDGNWFAVDERVCVRIDDVGRLHVRIYEEPTKEHVL